MDKKYLDPLIHILKIKTISTQGEFLASMEEGRHFLTDLFEDLGFKTQILKAKRHPAVFSSRIDNREAPTVLVYGHYDVQPPDPIDQWKSDPFNPIINGSTIYGRGTNDNKGQFMVHVMAIKKLLSQIKSDQKLPINIKFIIEGEEELGSISVEDLAKKYSKDLFKCDYLVVSDSEMLRAGQPSIDIGLRGLTYTEVFIETAKQDVHSGTYGGVAHNPAIILSQIIAQLKDKNNKVLVPNFYDKVAKLSTKEAQDYKKVAISVKELEKEGDLYSLGGGENKYALRERMWSQPTLDINGFTSGYQGEGSKTIIPNKASAKISMRLVANQNPDEIFKSFEKYVKKLTPKGVKVRVVDHSGALPYKAPTDHPVFEIIKKSLKKNFGKEPVFTGVGGSIGFIPVVANALKVPCIMVGFGLPGENLHAPNEHYSLINYAKGIDTMVDFYSELPNLKK